MNKKKKKKLIQGILILFSGIVVYFLRPVQFCKWYEFGCKITSIPATILFTIISFILIIVGTIKMVRK